jgi:hypothetical protein
MPQDCSNQIRRCHLKAERCRQLAKTARSEASKTDYLDLESRWLGLAKSYELTERYIGEAGHRHGSLTDL